MFLVPDWRCLDSGPWASLPGTLVPFAKQYVMYVENEVPGLWYLPGTSLVPPWYTPQTQSLSNPRPLAYHEAPVRHL